MRLRDKVALIRGSGSRIGRASSLLFTQEGTKIVVANIDARGRWETAQLEEHKR
jgi:NAD(P)-dependent dehydrogenase (short-subunit alcohol dehydrogenase family)